jgi:trimeric autotransporter adhesin
MKKSGESMRVRGKVVYGNGARVVCLGVLAGAGLALGQQQYAISTIAGGAPPATPAAATGTSVGEPRRVTMDSAGNLYFSSLNCVFKVSGGTLTLIAGNSRAGYSGDGGAAVHAQLNSPAGLAFDQNGDLFIADAGNNVVREVTPNGIIQTVAGNGTIGYSGDQGPATQAQLHTPSGVAVDGSGDLYIADTANNVIREVTAGIIVTFAGDGYANYYGDANGTGCSTASPCAVTPTQAEFHGPEDVAVGPNGGIYIVDTVNAYIREVIGGAVNFVAGSGTVGYSGDGGSATAPTTTNGGGVALYDPQAIAFDSAGNYYIADTGNNRIREVNTKGIINTVAGNGNPGFAGDGGPAGNAELNQPTGVFVDSQGNIYIADNLNNRVRKVSSSGTITTVAGNGLFSYSGDGGPSTAAQLNAPAGVAAGAPGTLFISDTQNAVARIVNQSGISSVGGGSFVTPRGMATDAAGNAFVADYQANVVWRIGTDGSVTKFAGTGTLGYGGDGGAAASAQLNAPTAVAVDTAGDVFIDDFGNQRIREVTTAGIINTVAGNGSQGYSGDGGPATNASLNQAQGIAVDASGNLYIADTANNVIREVTTNGMIRTIAGTGTFGYSGDGGPAINAQLTGPPAIAVDAAGNIYFIDGTTWIRKISSNGTIATIAGNGSLGYSGDAGLATKAQLNSPTALAIDSSGNVDLADTGNSAIRRLQPVSANMTISAVTNAASNQQGAIAPGDIVVLYGSGLGPSQAQSYQVGARGLVPTNLAGTAVLFNGMPGPVLYASPTQVSAVAPFELTGQTVQIAVQSQNQISVPVSVPLQAAAPGIFTTNESGQGQAVAFNQDQSLNAATNPAAQGSQLILYLTGGGQMPNSTDGSFAARPLPLIPLPVSVTIGGQTAQVNYAGAATGQVAGMVEIAVQVPSGVQPGGAVPVTVTIGGVSAQSGVTVAISQ